MRLHKIDYTEGMTELFAAEDRDYGTVSELVDCCVGDFIATLEMYFGEETDEGVCLFGNPDMCFQTSGCTATGDGGANFGQYALFILNLMKDGFETLDSDKKKAVVQGLIRDYEENGVEQGDELVLPPANQKAENTSENTFYVRKTQKGTVVEEQPVIGYENAMELAKEKMMVEIRHLIESGDNVNVARFINLGELRGYRLNNVTVITVETKAAA